MAIYQSPSAAQTSFVGYRRVAPKTNALGVNSYVKNLNTNTVTPFVSVPPSITESLGNTVNQSQIPGRSDPLFYYSNSGPRNITFTLSIIDDITPNGIIDTANRLRALAYPKYTGYVVSSPKCFLRVGKFISLLGFLENLEINWQPLPIRDNTYHYADFSFTFSQAVPFPFDASQVEQGVLT